VIRNAGYRPTALLLVLALLVMGAGLRANPCGGACCAADRGAVPASAGEAKQLSAPHACCCDSAPVPCDLEGAPAPDLPDSALSAAPRMDAPASLSAMPGQVSLVNVSQGVATLGRLRPSAQGPPGPVYLRTQSFLC